jgi:hypothetical protein
VVVPGKRLGARDPKNAKAMMFASFFKAVPSHPLIRNYVQVINNWDILGNDKWGDCGPVSISNNRALVSMVLGGKEVYPNLADTLDLYKRLNPDFNEETGEGDNGVDLQTMLEEVHRNGIAGSKCVAFAKVNIRNIDEVRAAIDIFGSVILGLDLQTAQQDQTAKGIWDYADSGEWGGHAILGGAYTSLTGDGQGDIGGITWAQFIALTDKFWLHQAMECWVVIWPEHYGTLQFEQGVDAEAFAEAYKECTGKDLPNPPSPAPVPNPVPPAPVPSPRPMPRYIQEMFKLWQELDGFLRKHGWIS